MTVLALAVISYVSRPPVAWEIRLVQVDLSRARAAETEVSA